MDPSHRIGLAHLFYKDKDIIVSANINGVLAEGAFDGFPTICALDASFCEVAMFCTDPLNLNQDRFKDGKEMVILKHSANDIVKKIEYYYKHPKELENICKSGKLKTEQLFGYESQMAPRIKLLREMIDRNDKVTASSNTKSAVRMHSMRSIISRITPTLMKRIYRKMARIIKRIKQI